MDGLTFYKVLSIIGRRYTDAVINRVTIVKDQLYISVYKDSIAFLTFKSTPPPSLEVAVGLFGDSHGALELLNGGTLVNVGCREFDRVGWFEVERRRPSGKLMRYRLIFEPMGNYANAFLVNEDNSILFSVSSRNIDPDRDIGVGKLYTLPKSNKKATLRNCEATQSFSDLVGFYPATVKMADDIADEIGFNGAVVVILEALESSDRFYKDAQGRIFPFPPKGCDYNTDFDGLTYIGSVHDDAAEVRARLSKYYEKQRQHFSKLLNKLEKELAEAQGWKAFTDEAELLRDNIYLISGKGSFVLTHYSESGEEKVPYVYDSDLSASVYIEKLFKRAMKLKRSEPQIKGRIAEISQILRSVDEQLYYIELADIAELRELSSTISGKVSNAKQKSKALPNFIEHRLGEDTILYIGRNSVSNHKLVFDFARGGDLWLHAHNIPSAHGILRKNGEITDAEIAIAASIIAGKSRNKDEKKVDVDYTYKRYVRKPKGTPAGFVIYDNFNTIIVEPML